jgi:hypothetical protein
VTEERIRARLAELQAQREQYLQQANLQIAALDGAIQALQGLLEPEPEPDPEPVPEAASECA